MDSTDAPAFLAAYLPFHTMYSGLDPEDSICSMISICLANLDLNSTWQICREKDAVPRVWEDVEPMEG